MADVTVKVINDRVVITLFGADALAPMVAAATGAAASAAEDADRAEAAANDPNVIAVAADLLGADTIGAVAAIAGSVTTVAGAVGNINITAGAVTNIGIAATNIAAINTAATNIAAIIAAPAAVTTATTQAGIATAAAASAAANSVPAGSAVDQATNDLRNLFDKSRTTDGQILNATTGALTANAAYFVTNYIPVVPGSQFTANKAISVGTGSSGVTYYNSSYTLVSGTIGAVAANTAVTVPATAGIAFVRFTVQVLATKYTLNVVRGATAATAYKSFGQTDKTAGFLQNQLALRAQIGETNRFSTSAVVSGSLVTASTGAYTVINSSRYATGDIPVVEGENLYISLPLTDVTPYGFGFFNVDKEFISGTVGPFGSKGATTDATGYAIGSTVITLASAGTGKIGVGDGLLFGADPNVYVVTSGDADVSNGGTVTIAGAGLIVAIPASATAISTIALVAYPTGTAYARGGFKYLDAPVEDLRITCGTAPVTGRRYFGSIDKFTSAALVQQTLLRALPIYTNLFDFARASDNNLLNASTGVLTVSAGAMTTDYMPCQPGGSIIVNYASSGSPYGIAFYDLAYTYVGGQAAAAANTAYTVPSNAWFWRYSFPKLLTVTDPPVKSVDRTQSLYCGLGASLPAGGTIGNYNTDLMRYRKWRGKNIASFGDSVTGQGTWQQALSEYLGATVRNYGVNGSTMANCITNAKVAQGDGSNITSGGQGRSLTDGIVAALDVGLLNCATNDWGGAATGGVQVPIGALTDTPSNNVNASFIASARYQYEYFLGLNYNMVVIGWGPLHRADEVATDLTRTIKLREYADAFALVAGYYGQPFWDAYRQSGITGLAEPGHFLADPVHPSVLGGSTRIGPRLGRFAERF